jgi:phage gp29-like protein
MDEMADRAEIQSQGAWERLLEPVRRLVANAASFEEIREGILDLYPQMEPEALSETLTDAMTAAFGRGRASVKWPRR